MEAFALGLIGIATLSLWLAIYVWALYAYGKRLASRFRLRVGLRFMAAALAIGFGFACSLAMLLPMSQFLDFFLGVGLWLLHAPSIFLGYWSGFETGRLSDERHWADNVHRWLNEWDEDGAPTWISARGEGDEGKTDD